MIYKIKLPKEELAFYQTWLFLWSCKLDNSFVDQVFINYAFHAQEQFVDYEQLYRSFEFVTITKTEVESNENLENSVNVPLGYIRIPELLNNVEIQNIKSINTEVIPGNLLSIRNKLVPQLMISPRQFDKVYVPFIRKINRAITPHFNNRIFWNLRYSTNLKLGSGVGSRGPFIEMKRTILKDCGTELVNSVLDIGCGDIEIVKSLRIKNYLGVDSSSNAISLAEKKKPNWTFLLLPDFLSDIIPSDIVICIDVLIHQSTLDDYKKTIDLAVSNCNQRLIISGFDKFVPDSYMISYYENLSDSLKAKGFKKITKVLEYNNTSLFVVDKETCQLPPVKPVDSGLVFTVLSNYMLRHFEKELFS